MFYNQIFYAHTKWHMLEILPIFIIFLINIKTLCGASVFFIGSLKSFQRTWKKCISEEMISISMIFSTKFQISLNMKAPYALFIGAYNTVFYAHTKWYYDFHFQIFPTTSGIISNPLGYLRLFTSASNNVFSAHAKWHNWQNHRVLNKFSYNLKTDTLKSVQSISNFTFVQRHKWENHEKNYQIVRTLNSFSPYAIFLWALYKQYFHT